MTVSHIASNIHFPSASYPSGCRLAYHMTKGGGEVKGIGECPDTEQPVRHKAMRMKQSAKLISLDSCFRL